MHVKAYWVWSCGRTVMGYWDWEGWLWAVGLGQDGYGLAEETIIMTAHWANNRDWTVVLAEGDYRSGTIGFPSARGWLGIGSAWNWDVGSSKTRHKIHA